MTLSISFAYFLFQKNINNKNNQEKNVNAVCRHVCQTCTNRPDLNSSFNRTAVLVPQAATDPKRGVNTGSNVTFPLRLSEATIFDIRAAPRGSPKETSDGRIGTLRSILVSSHVSRTSNTARLTKMKLGSSKFLRYVPNMTRLPQGQRCKRPTEAAEMTSLFWV